MRDKTEERFQKQNVHNASSNSCSIIQTHSTPSLNVDKSVTNFVDQHEVMKINLTEHIQNICMYIHVFLEQL